MSSMKMQEILMIEKHAEKGKVSIAGISADNQEILFCEHSETESAKKF